ARASAFGASFDEFVRLGGYEEAEEAAAVDRQRVARMSEATCGDNGSWISLPSESGILRQGTLDNVADVGGKGRCLRAAPQSRLSEQASARLQRAPALERRQQARSKLRIFAVKHQHDIDHKVVTGSVGAVELLLIGLSEGVDQGAHPIGIRE